VYSLPACRSSSFVLDARKALVIEEKEAMVVVIDLTKRRSGGRVGEGLKEAMVVVVGEGEGEPVMGIS